MIKHKGFTIIEIIMFLAMSAIVFIGVIAGVQNSVANHQFNDSVETFYEFLRSLYAKVINPQTTGDGNSDEVIHGVLAVFGESRDLLGNDVADKGTVYVYTVVASLKPKPTLSIKSTGVANINRFYLFRWKKGADGLRKEENGIELYSVEDYTPRWQTEIQNTSGAPYKGSIMILRYPATSGALTTLVSDKVIEVNDEVIKNANSLYTLKNKFNFLVKNDWRVKAVDFCVASDNNSFSRRDIRIEKNAANSSGVKKINVDDSTNRCK